MSESRKEFLLVCIIFLHHIHLIRRRVFFFLAFFRMEVKRLFSSTLHNEGEASKHREELEGLLWDGADDFDEGIRGSQSCIFTASSSTIDDAPPVSYTLLIGQFLAQAPWFVYNQTVKMGFSLATFTKDCVSSFCSRGSKVENMGFMVQSLHADARCAVKLCITFLILFCFGLCFAACISSSTNLSLQGDLSAEALSGLAEMRQNSSLRPFDLKKMVDMSMHERAVSPHVPLSREKRAGEADKQTNNGVLKSDTWSKLVSFESAAERRGGVDEVFIFTTDFVLFCSTAKV